MIPLEQFLRESVVPREVIDRFLDPDVLTWAQFDPEVGYILGNSMPPDGVDGSQTISTVTPNGARRSTIYADRPCRINTYGNSFTQCHQVSDHETWQEILGAHFGEPVRNFGVGGFGLYQAYRRMLRTEKTDDKAEYLLLYIWGDDHFRSLLRCRYALTQTWFSSELEKMALLFHGNFWSNLEMDLDRGEFVERDQILATPESLYKMTDPDFMVDALHDDLMLQMGLLHQMETSDYDRTLLNRLAECLGCDSVPDCGSPESREAVEKLRFAYAFAATRHILDKAAEFAAGQGRKLMILLFCPSVTRLLLEGKSRYDQPIVDYLNERGMPCFDANLAHVEDYKSFNLSTHEYLNRYLIGHYNPRGNHFFAFALKDALVEWLDPKPVTYRSGEQAQLDFREGYLPEV